MTKGVNVNVVQAQENGVKLTNKEIMDVRYITEGRFAVVIYLLHT